MAPHSAAAATFGRSRVRQRGAFAGGQRAKRRPRTTVLLGLSNFELRRLFLGWSGRDMVLDKLRPSAQVSLLLSTLGTE
jgi:hypothetical protein